MVTAPPFPRYVLCLLGRLDVCLNYDNDDFFHSDFVRIVAFCPSGVSNFIASAAGYPTSVYARTHFTVKSYVNSMLNTQFVYAASVDGCVLRLTSKVGVSPATVSYAANGIVASMSMYCVFSCSPLA